MRLQRLRDCECVAGVRLDAQRQCFNAPDRQPAVPWPQDAATGILDKLQPVTQLLVPDRQQAGNYIGVPARYLVAE